MAAQPKLVNKQFNSPIGLYSQQNIQEVLDRETQILANGAVGINFNNPDVGKPSNLKNSAVLRMLEEEENRQRNGIGPGDYNTARPLRENITWPPPEYEQKNSLRSTFKDVVVPGAKRVAWPPPGESGPDSPYVEQNAVSSQGGPQFSSQSPGFQQNNYQAPAQQRSVSSNPPTNRPLKPLDVSTGSSSPLSSPLLNQSPQGFRPATPAKGWAPVQSPVATPSPPTWQLQQQPLSPYQPSSATTTTRYQTAHQSVSQQTFLGQQYVPSSQLQYQTSPQQYQPPQQQYQAPQQQYQPPQQQYQPPQQQYQPPQQQYQPPQQQYQPPQQQYQPPQQQYQPPQQQYQPPQQQYQAPPQQYQAPPQQYQAPPQQYQAPPQQYQAPPQQYQAPPQQNQAFQPSQSAPKPAAAPSQVAPRAAAAAPTSKPAQPPPPTTITLRPNAPVSQAPPPVVTSQPATATLKGGKHLRGDLKWPPETVKLQFAEENRLRLELAQGPAVRPLRPEKDYTGFFAQHALNSTYPGYKIPPGTQFYRPE